MAVVEIALIQVRRGQERQTGIPQLNSGEFGWAEDTENLYIGKRIEEGAVNDDNTRILTDKDLKNIFDLINFGGNSPAVASTSSYRYRDNLAYSDFASTTTTIAKKLDNFISLTDFTPYNLSGDITDVLKLAISNLYANANIDTDAVRPLKIPAGTYMISSVVDLPPYATLIGDGAGITNLVLNNSVSSMFRTVDALGNHYEQGMQYGGQVSKEVHISNMTLCYRSGNTNNSPIINLDNTENPVINNVYFTTVGASLSTSTFVSTGTAISVRGSFGTDESTVISRNTQIQNCQFENIKLGFVANGHISKTHIDNCLFTNLWEGVLLTSTSTTTPVPSNTHISKNEFKFIRNSAVHVTTNTNRSIVVSSENQYYYVGNQSAIPDQNVTYVAMPVLTFDAPGNTSINDYFNRAEVSSNPINNFYYNPIANQHATVKINTMYNATVSNNVTNQPLVKIPLTNFEQMITIDYQLTNNEMSRKGKLTMNISADGYASVSDYYNYSEVIDNLASLYAFSTDMTHSPYNSGSNNYVSLTCSSFNDSNTTSETNLEFNIELVV